ncbi:hypothetical protein [Flaviaesturariibacter aridisoli]|uniref:Uncharacterized protein n=1 Tax=Flaviaesturariibacter aridisoli TaxID=2545761 RepID=A0A4R4DYB7_9BACT|nr:hypothetical protein [Flaviaesturariibacter aridisoli]RYY63258.1 MAG: hypothetical protein EOO12_12720 [Chitinophagaceae bacterium]RYY91921.1 MAG: hypothetical protein EOO11_22015 [Chitinophagaceae bacterium]TCZ68846.1 hypothetical protein E0486_13285 [Flaviaesturariibacter aridisoli]
MDEKDQNERAQAYPKPTQTDSQHKEQGEYLQRQSSRLTEQSEGSDTRQDVEQMRDANNQNTTEGIP